MNNLSVEERRQKDQAIFAIKYVSVNIANMSSVKLDMGNSIFGVFICLIHYLKSLTWRQSRNGVLFQMQAMLETFQTI